MKIAVIGYSGSGKSTLAKRLGVIFGYPVLHLDTVQFLPGWRERDTAEGQSIVDSFMCSDSWIIDGNYGKFMLDERLEQADMIVILKFSRLACLYRVCRRYSAEKGKTRDSMAEGCDEKLDAEFVRWVLCGGRTAKYRRRYRTTAVRYRSKTVVIKRQKQLDAFVRSLEA